MVSMERKKGASYILLLSIVLIALVLSAGYKPDGFQGTRIKSTEHLSEFLLSLGWECDLTRVTEQNAALPQQFDEIFIAYNAIQLKQNCDLTSYAGKEVKIYTVPITNFNSTTDTVLATVIVYKGKVIGGDLHAAAMDGFMQGLK